MAFVSNSPKNARAFSAREIQHFGDIVSSISTDLFLTLKLHPARTERVLTRLKCEQRTS